MSSMDMSPKALQKMMLTPKMLLTMHVLQLNVAALRLFLRAELEENPLLEEETQEEKPDEENRELDGQLSLLLDGDATDESGASAIDEKPYGISEEKRNYLETLITKKESLYEHLHWQLQVLAKDDEEKRIGEFIIGSLDDNGFLNVGLEEACELSKADKNSFNRALNLVRSFDPIGVGAQNIKESLLIQLVWSGKEETDLYRILDLYLEDLERGNYEKIAKALSLPVAKVKRAKKRIAYLNPKPGVTFGGQENISKIEPDIFLSKDNGSYNIEVNERDLPKISINRFYRNILKGGKAPRELKEYINTKIAGAQWLINAVKQRKKTIASVCEYLVDIQKDFLEKGDIAIKPLTLRQVAERLSISDATVSRVVSSKYGHISDRIFSLRDFFSGGIETIDGKFVSDKSVKQMIAELLEEENPKSPLSDQRIRSILKQRGINIARRTVTKYREHLGIQPFYFRKRS